MVNLTFVFKVAERFFSTLLYGEKLKDIKSMCLVDCGNFYHEKKDIDKAIKYYKRSFSLNPINYYACSGLAAALAEKGLFEEALVYCNKAISMGDLDILNYLLLVVIHESLGETVLAKEALQTTLTFFKNNSAAAFDRLGYTYLKFGMYQKAEFYCREALKTLPNEAGLHYNLAKVLTAQKKFEEAKAEFQKVLELTSNKRYMKYASENIKAMSVGRQGHL